MLGEPVAELGQRRDRLRLCARADDPLSFQVADETPYTPDVLARNAVPMTPASRTAAAMTRKSVDGIDAAIQLELITSASPRREMRNRHRVSGHSQLGVADRLQFAGEACEMFG